MFNTLKSAVKPFAVSLALATTLGFAGTASAAVIEFDWETTIDAKSAAIFGALGDKVTVTFAVDNGGSGALSQSWDKDDFQSWTATNGDWTMSSSYIDKSTSSGMFSTDASGLVTVAPEWNAGDWTPAVQNSFATRQVNEGYWQNSLTGNHGAILSVDRRTAERLYLSRSPAGNLVGSSWSVRGAAVAAVPEPSTYAMMAMGLFGIAGLRRRQNKA